MSKPMPIARGPLKIDVLNVECNRLADKVVALEKKLEEALGVVDATICGIEMNLNTRCGVPALVSSRLPDLRRVREALAKKAAGD